MQIKKFFGENFHKTFSKIKFDPYITILSFTLLILGFAIFFSASLGVMARYEAKFYNVLQNQALFGVLFGSLFFFVGAVFPKDILKTLSPFIYFGAIVLCVLVFVPGIGMEHGGAKRWIQIFGFTMQPSEILKYASIILLGVIYTIPSYFPAARGSNSTFFNWKNILFTILQHRFAPIFLLCLGVLIVLKEPDLGTSTIILSGIFSVFFILRAKWTDLVILLCLTTPILLGFYAFYPHAKERVNTFLSPDKNSGHQNYQVQQTRISLGAGGLWGEGYAMSLQKYHHLPEPIGDSIFAVLGEEFGLFGVTIILFLILFLGFRLIYVSQHIRDPFGKSILIGTGTIILVQTFLNAGSSSAAIPFTGVPLPLISHGSTSIIITMTMLGLCAQISAKKYIS